jgi:hypothetical protein
MLKSQYGSGNIPGTNQIAYTSWLLRGVTYIKLIFTLALLGERLLHWQWSEESWSEVMWEEFIIFNVLCLDATLRGAVFFLVILISEYT